MIMVRCNSVYISIIYFTKLAILKIVVNCFENSTELTERDGRAFIRILKSRLLCGVLCPYGIPKRV